MDSWPEFSMVREWIRCRICGFTKKDKIMYITEEAFLMGRITRDKLSQAEQDNMDDLLTKVNKLIALYAKIPVVTSGYRTPAANAAAGGAKLSNHMICRAVDLSDPDGDLAKWCLKNLNHLKDLGLYCEDFRWTHVPGGKGSWCHFQNVSPKSGKIVFVPNSNPPSDPNFWDGKYDSKYD
jgi:hypothetical protein